ncbi:MAG: hypothetical protein HS132_04495 [Planctomycetia bacterium]|nr:hypothetical protein [Planctomycetia bacterium]
MAKILTAFSKLLPQMFTYFIQRKGMVRSWNLPMQLKSPFDPKLPSVASNVTANPAGSASSSGFKQLSKPLVFKAFDHTQYSSIFCYSINNLVTTYILIFGKISVDG